MGMGGAGKFNTVAARPGSGSDRNLPSSWKGSQDDGELTLSVKFMISVLFS